MLSFLACWADIWLIKRPPTMRVCRREISVILFATQLAAIDCESEVKWATRGHFCEPLWNNVRVQQMGTFEGKFLVSRKTHVLIMAVLKISNASIEFSMGRKADLFSYVVFLLKVDRVFKYRV